MTYFWKALTAPAAALLLVGATAPDGKWTPAWTASMWQSANPRQEVAVDNATLSFAVRVGADGKALRIRLSNEYGSAFRIGAASIRLRDGKTVPITFGGKAATEVSANGVIVSDPVRMTVKSFDVVDVSLYLPGSVRLNTVHAASGAKTQISAPGDHSRAPFVAARRADNRPLLASIDVLGNAARPVVVAFGDSITDNPGCAIDATPVCRWSDVLGRRLAKAGKPHAVVTQAISGNRVISRGTGPSAIERFDRDVLALPGVTHIVLLEGINDIGGSGRALPDGTTAPTITDADLMAGYRDLVARAHGRGIKVIAMTILPFEGAGYHSAAGEAMRTRINDWIRSSGTFDSVVDMEKVVADPANPKRLAPALHRGDFLHPNDQGEFAMGEAIPLNLFD